MSNFRSAPQKATIAFCYMLSNLQNLSCYSPTLIIETTIILLFSTIINNIIIYSFKIFSSKLALPIFKPFEVNKYSIPFVGLLIE